MKKETREILEDLVKRYPDIEELSMDIEKAFEVLKQTYLEGNKLMVCGNGGSASDSEHLVAELMKNFRKNREIPLKDTKDMPEDIKEGLQKGYPAISLCGHPAFTTAFINDCDPDFVFAQQVFVLGNKGDTLLVISTSGNSKNCIIAAEVARARDIKVIGLLGNEGGMLKHLCDVSIIVNEKITFKIQERHLPIYHCLAGMIEAEL